MLYEKIKEIFHIIDDVANSLGLIYEYDYYIHGKYNVILENVVRQYIPYNDIKMVVGGIVEIETSMFSEFAQIEKILNALNVKYGAKSEITVSIDEEQFSNYARMLENKLKDKVNKFIASEDFKAIIIEVKENYDEMYKELLGTLKNIYEVYKSKIK